MIALPLYSDKINYLDFSYWENLEFKLSFFSKKILILLRQYTMLA